MILEASVVLQLAASCQVGTSIEPNIIQRIAEIESSYRPLAVAIVGLEGAKRFQQPETIEEASSFIESLDERNFNYSVGLMQVNKTNFEDTGLDFESAFDPCKSIEAGAKIFHNCLVRAEKAFPSNSQTELLNKAASCYYSGNFKRGFVKEGDNQLSYVDKFSGIAYTQKTTTANQEEKNLEKPVPKSHEHWDVFKDF
ncbi:lytic transglycosylase domain-containing protein [Thaumasiovibrio subtropicus]|uniref:lytic transglycosylase domain-containing protein n=1 Tax=Thaumasiovibrio subtropicus TaxID=1891207 RepID=UPI000B351CBA|nr:lytic transglycosylase domain-containing protein [Thaumasiovibrio subtropicus]